MDDTVRSGPVTLLAPDEAAPIVEEGRPPSDAEVVRSGLLGKAMPDDRLKAWLITGFVALLGGVVRFQNLGYPTDQGTPVFDEKHYVPQAWQMLRNGGVEDNAGYELIVHPPLGKQLIASGEWLFGYTPGGWRFPAALGAAPLVVAIVRG